MNEEVKKIIKSSFCPKEKWIADDDAKHCFKCNKKFHPLYRRKHHCRSCGQIFCSECSDFFISGKDLGQPEKNVRMCQVCNQKCWKYIVKHDERYTNARKSGNQNSQSLPENLEELQLSKSNSNQEKQKLLEINNLIKEYGQDEASQIKGLQDKVNKKFLLLLQVLLKDAGIPLRYLTTINETARKIHQLVQPNAMITENMSISQHLRVKTFHSESDEVSFNLEQGVLLKKKFTGKKLQQEYSNIRAILVYGGIEAHDLLFQKQISFQNMVSNRVQQMKKLVHWCKNIKIEIIFIQGSIEKQFQAMLNTESILVVPKVKVETLCKVKHALNINFIVESISKVHTHTEQQIVGTISKMTTLTEKSIKEGGLIKKFYYISSLRPELGLTLFLRSSNHETMLKIRKELKFILQLIRHMNLKVHKVLLDQSLLKSMSELMKNSCYLNCPEIFFTLYSEHHSDILNYLKEKYLSYKQIVYVDSNFANYPEVTKEGLQQYLSGRLHSFSNKWQNFTEICGQIKDQHQIYYSEEDTPMGAYILRRLSELDRKCTECGKPKYNHSDVFYSTDQYVRIWTESRILQDLEEEEVFPINTRDDLIMVFESQEQKKLTCHIECQQCQQMISAKKILAKQHLEYSFLAFLNHMFKGSLQTKIRENNKKKYKPKGNTTIVCQHKNKIRVFQLGDKSLKIFVGKYTVNRQCILTPTGRQNFLKQKADKYSLQKCLLETNKIERIGMFMLQEIRTIADSAKITNFDSILKNPKSSFIKVKSSIMGNVRLSQAQCVDMILPELIDQLTKLNNVAVIVLNTKRVTNYLHAMKITHAFLSLLKRIYTVIVELKKSVKKRDLDMKFQSLDFQDEAFMEDIDMNSILEASSIELSSKSDQTCSQISKQDLYSTYAKDDLASIQNRTNYEWLQPQEEKVLQSRFDRKTEYNFGAKRNNRATEEQTIRQFKEISSILRVENAFFDYVPCYPNRSQSLIASSLNSQIHKECLLSTSFKDQIKIQMNGFLQTDIALDYEEIAKVSMMISLHEKRFDVGDRLKRSPTIAYEVTLLCPNEFQILRREKKIPLQLFISSIGGAECWLASGGKSGSSFMRSFNDLLVIKRVNEKEFRAFTRMMKEYFNHLHKGSLLTPVYGAFIVSRSNTHEYFIVMENLFFAMRRWYLYDFKGSVNRRFSKPPTIPLDINFLIDKDSEPIFSKDNVLKHLSSTLDFLVKYNVVDYSLILVVQIANDEDYYLDGNRFQIGIVDYMRDFGTGEFVERLWKGEGGTVQQPSLYKERMMKNMKKYFTQIPL